MSISKENYKNKEKFSEFDERVKEPKRKKKVTSNDDNPKIIDNKIRMFFS